MDLLVLTEDFYPSVSGGAHARWRFAQIATKRGHNISVVTPRQPDTPKFETVDGVDIARPFPSQPSSVPAASPVATATRLFHSGAVFAWLQWWARNRQFDAVYSASNTLHWVASAFGQQRDVPSVSFVGYTPSMRPEIQPRLKLALERLNFKYGMADTVFCRLPEIRDLIADASNADVQLIDGVLNAERIQDAHSQAQQSTIRTDYAGDEERLLVFVGRLNEEKNIPGLIRILSELPPSYRLAVVGDGPERDTLHREIEDAGVQDRVTVCGQLSHEEALSIIAVSDGLLLPSHTEAYPTVVFEGLALGCTVFATPVGILPSVDHPRLYLDPVEEISDTIRNSQFEQTQRLDEQTMKQYSMERFADQILGAIGV